MPVSTHRSINYGQNVTFGIVFEKARGLDLIKYNQEAIWLGMRLLVSQVLFINASVAIDTTACYYFGKQNNHTNTGIW